jgi:chromate reductase, NAD(P)H dehydrogenase (quinone)
MIDPMTEPVRLLLVSGSTRGNSTNTAALRTILSLTAPPSGLVRAVLYDGLSLLPAFNPDDDHEPLPSEVVRLRQQIAAADAVLFCTPEYAGNLPGSFKNLLDWTVGGGEMYGKPAAWINVAPEGRGDAAQAALTGVLGYVGATLIEPACRRIQVDRSAIGRDGLVAAPAFRPAATQVLQAILTHLGES